MKKLLSFLLAVVMTTTCVSAFTFPEPDWGALLNEKKKMVNETDFELYCEAPIESAPYFGARLEPRGGTYFGMIAENSEFIDPICAYLTYFSMSLKQTDMYYPANNIIKGSDCITTIGYTVDSLGNVDYGTIRKSLDTLAALNKPMFIRFANEMNVSTIGNDPELYKVVFRTVADMVHQYPNFAVVWSPNDLGGLDRPFDYYYPGDKYVDWIGVSSYQKKYFMGSQDTTEKDSIYFMTGDYAWTTNALKPIIKFMEDNNINKPVMISEGGVATQNKYGENLTTWATPRLRNMYYNTIMKYPQVKLINYFNTYRPDETENYYVKDYMNPETKDKPYAMNILKEAASSGAYITEYGKAPDFVFGKASDGYELTAEDGIIRLYTLAYLPKIPEISVNYLLDGTWFHCSNNAPYTCNMDISSMADGEHTLEIAGAGLSKKYTFYKYGDVIRFGGKPQGMPEMKPEPEPVPDPTPVPEPVPEPKTITVTVNGKKLEFDTEPTAIDGRVLVPIRAIFTELGAEVTWNDEIKTAIARGNGHTIHMVLDQKYFLKDGSPVSLSVPATAINGRILVPIRAISQALDCDVYWDGVRSCVVITTK